MVLALAFVVGAYAQSEVHIVQETGTKVLNLDDVRSIELVDEPWSEWEYTSGVYNFSWYVSGAYPIQVLYRENLIDRTKMQFLFKTTEIGTKEDILVDVDKETGACQVGIHDFLDNANYGPVFVSDIPHNPFDLNKDGERETYEEYPCTYNPQRGLFTLNLVYFVYTDLGSSASGYFGYGVETIQLDGFYIPDYSFDIQYAGPYVDDYGNEFAAISTVKGTDVAKYLMTVVGAGEDADAAILGMLEGSVPCDILTETGLYTYSMTTSGKYRALAITFDAEENVLGTYSTEFEFYLSSEGNPWQSLGYAVYTDDLILPLYGNPAMQYYVEVLENQEQPGLFRMVDPYGPEFPLYPYASSYEEGSYIEIDATDPEGVWIEGWQSTGLDVQNNGLMSVTSMAWYQASNEGTTKEDAKEAGLCGVYADGIITFPVNGLVVGIGTKAYYGNRNGAFALDMTNLLESLPENAGAARAPKARLGRIQASEAFELPAKKNSFERKNSKLNSVEPNVNAVFKPVAPVKIKKVDASQNALVEM